MIADLVLLAAGKNRRLGSTEPKALWTSPDCEPVTPLASRLVRQAHAHNVGSIVVCRPEHRDLFTQLPETAVVVSPYANDHPGSLASLLVGLEAALRRLDSGSIVVADGDVAVSDEAWELATATVRDGRSALIVMPANEGLDNEAVGVYPGVTLTIAKGSELAFQPEQPVLGEATGIGVMSASDAASVLSWARNELDRATISGSPLTSETEDAWRWLATRGLGYSLLPPSAAFIECDTLDDMAALAELVAANRFRTVTP